MAFPAGKEPSSHSTSRAQRLHPGRATSTGINQPAARQVQRCFVLGNPQETPTEQSISRKNLSGQRWGDNPCGQAGFLHSQQGLWGVSISSRVWKGVSRMLRGSSILLAQHKAIPMPWWDGGARMLIGLAGAGKQLEKSRDSF